MANGVKLEKPGGRARRADGRARSVNFGRLPTYIGYQVRQAQTAIFRDLQASLAGLNVTPGEFGLLSLIDANPGVSQVDLAEIYRLDKSTLSLVVSRVAKRGLIERRHSPHDGRYYALWLRPPGRSLLRRLRAHVEAQERAMDATLRLGERRQLLDMLRRISHVFKC
jgi:DNA-binding MarR family transcriptional regulator